LTFFDLLAFAIHFNCTFGSKPSNENKQLKEERKEKLTERKKEIFISINI